MDTITKLKVKYLLKELLDDHTPLERKKAIITELRTLNSEFDDAIEKLGINHLLLDSDNN